MKNLEELETVLRNVRYEIQQFLNEPKADFTNIEYMIYETIEAARALKFYIRIWEVVNGYSKNFNPFSLCQ